MSIPIKMMLEWLTHENAQLNRQVTDLQARGTELVEENRELMREMLTTLAEVCAGADEHAQAPWPWPLTRLAQELRRRVEKLEAERAR